MHKSLVFASLTAFSTLALAAPRASAVSKRCEFDSASTPDCWGDYSLSTNWYDEVPDTGVTREYWLELVNITAAPDGVERVVLAVNGTVPGPTIEADWGDMVVIHVLNSLQDNGTSIHWHGIRQNYTYQEDGVASITQCPTAPGDSITYKWRATQYGTSWYHSHFSLQAWNGVFGGVKINGPATAPYNEDKGIMMLSDWYHQTSDELFMQAQTSGPPTAQSGLFNGVGVYGSLGQRYNTTVTAGQTYRYRLINGAMDTHFKFSIDNHDITIISADFVPVEPYTVDILNIGIGQRYDILVTANQTAGNYWMRAIPQLACSANENTLNIKAILNYDSVDIAEPTTTMSSYVDACSDETLNLTPYLSLDAGNDAVEHIFDIGISVPDGLFRWTVNNNTFLSDWGVPTLQKVNDNITSFELQENVVHINEDKEWVYFVVESALSITHPIHLHGHDFFVLSQEAASTFSNETVLNLSNPMRRDVALLPAGGHLVIAFKPDNPGVWLMHCHIGWHASEGFALQLVERYSEIAAITDASAMDETCTNWNTYSEAINLVQDDSGI